MRVLFSDKTGNYRLQEVSAVKIVSKNGQTVVELEPITDFNDPMYCNDPGLLHNYVDNIAYLARNGHINLTDFTFYTYSELPRS